MLPNRPISLTCFASKIMEQRIAKHIYYYLQSNKLISTAQHEFIKGRSMCINVLESMNDWPLFVQNKKCVTIAYVDFRPSFDSVSHESCSLDSTHTAYRWLLYWPRNFFASQELV